MTLLEKIIAFFRAIFSPPTQDEKAPLPELETNKETPQKQVPPAPVFEKSLPPAQPLPEKITCDELVDYLVEAESYTVHYNKGERGKTAPAGIYHKYYPRWEGWRFLTQIAQEYDIRFDPAASDNIGCAALTEVIVKEYKKDMDTLIYTFVQREYFQKLNLDLFPGKKSALSYFSVTVNAGKRRAAKVLQKALVANGATLKVDGKAGAKTYRALVESGLDDDFLNQQILLQVYYFYNYLVGKNPAKYNRFYRGWINRLKRLGFEEPKR